MEENVVYEGYFLVCEAGTEICVLKCFNKGSLTTDVELPMADTGDNTKRNILSYDGNNFGNCAVKGKCDLEKLGAWTEFHPDFLIGSENALKRSSKLLCTAAFTKFVTRDQYIQNFALLPEGMSLESVGPEIEMQRKVTGTAAKYITPYETLNLAMKALADSPWVKQNYKKEMLENIGAMAGMVLTANITGIGAAIGAMATPEFGGFLMAQGVMGLESRYDKYMDMSRAASTPEGKKFYKDLFWTETGSEFIIMGAGAGLEYLKTPQGKAWLDKEFPTITPKGQTMLEEVFPTLSTSVRSDIIGTWVENGLNNEGIVVTGGNGKTFVWEKPVTKAAGWEKYEMIKAAQKFRAGLPGDELQNFGNVGIIRVKKGTEVTDIPLHSRINSKADPGWKEGIGISDKLRYFDSHIVTRNNKKIVGYAGQKGSYLRIYDTETKGLSYIIGKFPESYLDGAEIIIFTERIPCVGCATDIATFNKNWWNTTVEVFHTNGNLLIPK